MPPPPQVPANTPATQSLIDDVAALDIQQATEALSRIQSTETVGARDRSATPTNDENTPPNEHVHEHSDWEELASEDLNLALRRAQQYAEDMVKKNPGKTLEEFYSEKVAEAINKGGLKFDKTLLK